MVHNVVSHGVELLHHGRNHQLGADTVDRDHHDGLLPLGQVNAVKPPEAANRSEHLGSSRRGNPPLYILQQLGCQVNVAASLFVGFALAFHLAHIQRVISPDEWVKGGPGKGGTTETRLI